MPQFVAHLEENRPLGRSSFVLRLSGCEALAGARPGQFVMVRGDWGRDPLLPRAFSILRMRAGGICEILVKAIGRGTRLFELLKTGAPLSVLGPLGKPFPVPDQWPGDYLVAGGVGLAPLLWFAESYRPKHSHQIIYGVRTADDLVLLDEIRQSGAALIVTTEDGRGEGTQKGRVTDALAQILPRRSAPGTRILTCGPNPMMRAVVELARQHELPCWVSVEGEMACGIGACLGCAVPLTDGSRPYGYACVDGPVFDSAKMVLP